jgi:threonyl-tRNA synthetase
MKYSVATVVGLALLPFFHRKRGGANMYDVSGLEFWGESEIKLRNEFVKDMVGRVHSKIKPIKMTEIDAPILTPNGKVSKTYKKKETFTTSDKLTLRPQIAPGTYAMATKIIKSGRKLPFAIWQHGKVFHKDSSSKKKNMKLKEMYQLTFQIFYVEDHPKISSTNLIKAVKDEIQDYVGRCRVSDSQFLAHSKWTKTIERSSNAMALATISERHDFTTKYNRSSVTVLEISICTDRIVYNHQKWKGKR